jgi:hypothetical protein
MRPHEGTVQPVTEIVPYLTRYLGRIVGSEAAQNDAVLSNNSRPGPDAAAQQIIF